MAKYSDCDKGYLFLLKGDRRFVALTNYYLTSMGIQFKEENMAMNDQ